MAGTSPGKRFSQANREALLALALYAGYFVWWYAFAYGLGSGDPKDYSYVLGFPSWFFFSCIAGFPLLTLAVWLMVRYGYKDMPLDSEEQAAPCAGSDGPGPGAFHD